MLYESYNLPALSEMHFPAPAAKHSSCNLLSCLASGPLLQISMAGQSIQSPHPFTQWLHPYHHFRNIAAWPPPSTTYTPA